MKRKLTFLLAPILALSLCGFSCNTGTKKLAVASDAISHALLDAQQASQQAAQQGVISAADDAQFEDFLARAASAGLILDRSIRGGESATSVSAKVDVFLNAFNDLQKSGVAGIKNKNLQLTISTIVTGAETSLAVIEATVGTGKGQ